MSEYTIEVRKICAAYAGFEPKGLAQIKYCIDQAIPSVFDTDDPYPIYNEGHRAALNAKILRHYWMHEIGAETVDLWLLYLNTSLNEIMPKYNKLYAAAAKDIDPFNTIDFTTVNFDFGNRRTDDETKSNRYESNVENGSANSTSDSHGHNQAVVSEASNSNASNSDIRKYSDTPQGELDDVADGKYLTNYTDDSTAATNHYSGNTINTTDGNRSDSASTSNQRTGIISATDSKDGKSSEMYSDNKNAHTTGRNSGKTYSELLDDFRKQVYDIDSMIMDELASCFMLLH